MDVEAPIRNELRDLLSSGFETLEEVHLCSRENKTIRADVVASPNEVGFENSFFAFEVKAPASRNFNKWTHVFKQAHDYVGAKISSGKWQGHVVTASFVYPAPPYDPFRDTIEESDYWRDNEGRQLAGVMHMASLLKVGAAHFRSTNPSKGLNSQFGPNTIWNQNRGWFENGYNLLSSRRVGSRRVRAET